jgi:hypothetical protein
MSSSSRRATGVGPTLVLTDCHSPRPETDRERSSRGSCSTSVAGSTPGAPGSNESGFSEQWPECGEVSKTISRRPSRQRVRSTSRMSTGTAKTEHPPRYRDHARTRRTEPARRPGAMPHGRVRAAIVENMGDASPSDLPHGDGGTGGPLGSLAGIDPTRSERIRRSACQPVEREYGGKKGDRIDGSAGFRGYPKSNTQRREVFGEMHRSCMVVNAPGEIVTEWRAIIQDEAHPRGIREGVWGSSATRPVRNCVSLLKR